jgi:hypothetical protein
MASRLIQQGADVETVQLLLGHAELYASEYDVIFATLKLRARKAEPLSVSSVFGRAFSEEIRPGKAR